MMQLIECVPNFSEGRDPIIVNEIAGEFRNLPDVLLIGQEMDYDHNRSVITCIGSPHSVVSAVYNACRKAKELIDLRNHHGVHPRIGATDVIPLVPLRNISMSDCVDLSYKLGHKIAKDMEIPVYLYGSASKRFHNKSLADIRRGEFEYLQQLILNKSDNKPDFGPSTIHPSAGAIAIGVRDILVAFNVNLRSKDIDMARMIAREIRESNGGLPGVKALGLKLSQKKCVQISMNITDYKQTSIPEVYRFIKRKANSNRVEILECELIGLAPIQAFNQSNLADIQLKNMTPSRYLDYHIKRAEGILHHIDNI